MTWKWQLNDIHERKKRLRAFFGCTSSRKVKAWRQKRTLSKVLGGKASHEPRRWEQDYQLVECEGLFEEYLEMGKFLLFASK